MTDTNISNYYNNRYNTYVGARYVPIFDGEWNNSKTYETLVVVTNEGNSYISKTNVPVGVNISNENYWLLFSNYNAQMANIIQQIQQINSTIDAVETTIDGINGKVKVINDNMPFSPTDINKPLYQNMVLRNIASYLIRANFCDCVVGTPISDANKSTIFKYSQNQTCLSLVSDYLNEFTNFVYNETEVIEDNTYHIAFLDCSAFTSLITRGRRFDLSPYYYTLTVNSPKINEMKELCLQIDENNAGYTFDNLNSRVTHRMARQMNSSGCKLKYVSNHNAGADVVLYNDTINELETGDLIFWGNSTNFEDGDFLGIYHCGIFVKDLNELNAFGSPYNISFKTTNNTTTQYGYFIDCSNPISGAQDYQNILRILTLEECINRSVRDNWSNVYTCKSWANAMNGNIQHGSMNGQYREQASTYFANIGQLLNPYETLCPVLDNYNDSLYLASVGTYGLSLTEGEDLNDYCDNKHCGIFKATSDVANTLLNTPIKLASPFVLEVFGVYSTWGVQRLTVCSNNAIHAYYRTFDATATPGAWREFTTTEVSS